MTWHRPGALAGFALLCAAGCNALLEYDQGELAADSTSDAGSGGDGGAVACNEDPWTCEPPRSCWLGDDYTFRCVDAGEVLPGSECQLTIGETECIAGYFCYAGSGTPALCIPFCDPASPEHACAAGVCTAIRMQRPDNQEQLPPIWGCVL